MHELVHGHHTSSIISKTYFKRHTWPPSEIHTITYQLLTSIDAYKYSSAIKIWNNISTHITETHAVIRRISNKTKLNN